MPVVLEAPVWLWALTSRFCHLSPSAVEEDDDEDGHTVVATARGVFNSNGGVLSSIETGVSIIIPQGAIPEGTEQEIYFKVCRDNSILPPLDKEKGNHVCLSVCLLSGKRCRMSSYSAQARGLSSPLLCLHAGQPQPFPLVGCLSHEHWGAVSSWARQHVHVQWPSHTQDGEASGGHDRWSTRRRRHPWCPTCLPSGLR